MATNRFAKASTPAPAKPKAGKKAKARLQVTDLHTYAAIQAVKKTLETLEKTLKTSVNNQALEHFVAAGNDESIEGFEPFTDKDGNVLGHTEASLQLRKRSSTSKFGDQEKAVLDNLGISVQRAPGNQFVINNAYAENNDLLERVSKALDGVKGIPEDFIQVAPEQYVTTDTSIAETFAKVKDVDQLRDVLRIVGVLASRPVFGGSHDDMVKILDEVLRDAKDGSGFDAAK